MYYLQSRYYSSEWGRFINANGELGAPGDLLAHNMFAYCMNNPVNMEDQSGHFALPLVFGIVTGALEVIGGAVLAVVTSPVVIGAALIGATGFLIYSGYQYYRSTQSMTYSETKSSEEVEGPYSHIPDSTDVKEGKDFTASQKKKIINENKKRNGGKVKSDDESDFYEELVKPAKSMKGVTPPENEWQIDHIISKAKGGTNSFRNARVISRKLNRLKWDK